jgi:hypothetical protein
VNIEFHRKQRSFQSRVLLCAAVAVPVLLAAFAAWLNGFFWLALFLVIAGSVGSYLYEREFRCPSCGSRLQASQRAWLRVVIFAKYIQFFGPRPDTSVPCYKCGATVNAA